MDPQQIRREQVRAANEVTPENQKIADDLLSFQNGSFNIIDKPLAFILLSDYPSPDFERPASLHRHNFLLDILLDSFPKFRCL